LLRDKILEGGVTMPARKMCARQFYPGDCRAQIEKFLERYEVPEKPLKPVAGIVPHAGWIFSGEIAAKVFKCISVKSEPDTFILLGSVHTMRPRGNSLYARGSWETPFGEVRIDEEVAGRLLALLSEDIVEEPAAHAGEHSIEVQVPFIKYLRPHAKIVPVAVPPDDTHVTGRRIGEAAAEIGGKIVVVGTTDLTHYGDAYGFTPYGYGDKAKRRMRENDFRMIELAINMKASEIGKEAERNRNACGPGALAATVSAAGAMGAEKGHLIKYATSYDVMPEGEFEMAVGYAGIVF
jgi:AmmeMemoRadiSam system protein B